MLDREDVLSRANNVVGVALVKAVADVIETRFTEIKDKYPGMNDDDALNQSVEFVSQSLRSGLVGVMISGKNWRRAKDD